MKCRRFQVALAILVVLTLLVTVCGPGATPVPGPGWTIYTTKDGLAQDDVSSIIVAPDGALWFGTHGGVSRYLPPD